MSESARELIERMERETGQRIDDNDGDNFAVAGLIGAMVRALGKSNHPPRDDVAVGIVTRDNRPSDNDALLPLLLMGISPDDIKSIGDSLKGE